MKRPREYWLLSALAEVAWADGVLRPSEAQLFLDVLAGLDVSQDLALEICRTVLTPIGPRPLDLELLDDDDRRWILGFGHLMSAVDGEVAESEMATLRDLARRLDVPWVQAQKIFHEADTIRPMVMHTKGART